MYQITHVDPSVWPTAPCDKHNLGKKILSGCKPETFCMLSKGNTETDLLSIRLILVTGCRQCQILTLHDMQYGMWFSHRAQKLVDGQTIYPSAWVQIRVHKLHLRTSTASKSLLYAKDEVQHQKVLERLELRSLYLKTSVLTITP